MDGPVLVQPLKKSKSNKEEIKAPQSVINAAINIKTLKQYHKKYNLEEVDTFDLGGMGLKQMNQKAEKYNMPYQNDYKITEKNTKMIIR